jgi:mechanosensitive ion channel-like protein
MERSTVADWGATLMASTSSALAIFLGALPRIVGFAVILIVGWLIAALIAKGVAVLLRSVNFNDLAQRAGLSEFVSKMGIRSDSAGFLAGIAKWFVRLIALVVAFDALGLPAVSGVFREFLLWLPNLFVAMVVLVIGGLAAKALSALVRGATSTSQLGNPQALARVTSTVVWAFTLVVAVNQLGIAETLVNTLVMATVGALALALGLAFGLGGRDTAGQIVRKWYARSQQNASRAREAVEHAADAAHEAVDHPERVRTARAVLSSSEPTEHQRT